MFNLGEFSMKKTLVAIAALAAVSSFAQSTVTLYGVADVWLGSLKQPGVAVTATKVGNVVTTTVAPGAGVTQTLLNTGGLSGSRFGLRGSEDLGGGLKANFVMENGHNTDTGTAAQQAASTSQGMLFGRQTFVGLSGGFGEVRFGRQYPAYDEARGGADLFGHSAFSSNTASSSWQGFGRDYTYRVNNAIHYISPNFGGVTGAFTYTLGENKTVAFSAGKIMSLRLNYANGPIALALAHQNEKNAAGNIASGASNSGALGQFDGANLFGIRNVTLVGYTPVTSESHTFLSGAYDFGVARAQLAFNRSKDNSGLGADKDMALNVAVPVGPTTIVAGLSRAKLEGAKSSTVALQATYALSKRTNVYGGLSYTTDKFVGLSNKRNLTAVGIRHTF
jgi:predicted porin